MLTNVKKITQEAHVQLSVGERTIGLAFTRRERKERLARRGIVRSARRQILMYITHASRVTVTTQVSNNNNNARKT